MPSFLTPWLLGGLLLASLPWLIHRIRRPERDRVPFSSLMFVPSVERQVIERRNLQHILLMLMRITLVILLTIAFARPFLPGGVTPAEETRRAGDHVLLIDVSASMQTSGYLDRAIAAAHDILNARLSDDRISVVTFARHPRVILPLDQTPETDRIAAARIALAGVVHTFESTDYPRALESALDQLRRIEGQPDRERVIHLVSDLQSSGLPPDVGSMVPAGIELRFAGITAPRRNATLQDAVITPTHRNLIARTRLRNWNAGPEFTVRLHIQGHDIVERRVLVPPGNASRIDVPLGPTHDHAVTGYFEIDADDLHADNRRYFTWQPQRKWNLGLIDRSGMRPFISAAIPDDPRLPFQILQNGAGLTEADILITDDLDENELGRLERGTPIILLPSRLTVNTGLETALAHIGIRSNGVRTPRVPEQVAWADFDHSIFHPLRAPGYNDFTALRFAAHLDLQIGDADTTVRVLSRLESGHPAFLEKKWRDGRLLIWTAGLDPRWSSTIRDPRFIPLLHESLRYLAGTREHPATRLVGDPLLPPNATPGWHLDDANDHSTPGIQTWRLDDRTVVEAVNLDPVEGDLATADEILTHTRLTGAAQMSSGVSVAGAFGSPSRIEYGRTLLILVVLLACVEGVYAATLNRSEAAS